MKSRFISLIVIVCLCAMSTASFAAKPEIDPTYANGQTVYMIGPHLIEGAAISMPNAYAHSEELYLLVYPQQPAKLGDPLTLPSGYQPQCNPCFHPGLPMPFVYHDHVITGTPGLGINGTAKELKTPWKIILLVYNPTVVNSPGFVPIKSVENLDLAEGTGEFLPINPDPNAANPYEIDTGNLLYCPIVSPHA